MLLFSINTVLAFRIQKTYYGNVHYVWCADKYDYGFIQPASSNPLTIATQYLRDVLTKDEHSSLIKQNRDGLKRGAMFKRQAGIIEEEEAEIIKLVNNAGFDQFLPILYVIPYDGVKTVCKKAKNDDRAAPHSVEYIIEELQRDLFSIVDIGKTMPKEIGDEPL